MKVNLSKIVEGLVRVTIALVQFALFGFLFILPLGIPALHFSKYSFWYLIVLVPIFLFLFSTIDLFYIFKQRKFVLKKRVWQNFIDSSGLILLFYIMMYIYAHSPVRGSLERSYTESIYQTIYDEMRNTENPLLEKPKQLSEMFDSTKTKELYLTNFIVYEVIPTDIDDLEWICIIKNSRQFVNGRCIDSDNVIRGFRSESNDFSVEECLEGTIYRPYNPENASSSN